MEEGKEAGTGKQGEYFVLVTPGLEFIAAEELRRNPLISNIKYNPGSGFVSFTLPSNALVRSEWFGTVEGLFILVKKGTHEGLSTFDKDKALMFFGQLPFDIDVDFAWNTALDKWSATFGLPRPPTVSMRQSFEPDESIIEKQQRDMANSNNITTPSIPFRCSCLREGSHQWDSVFAAGVLGAGLVERFGWPVSLKK